jgi:hypothetical protein
MAEFEPASLVPNGAARLTECGKFWLDQTMSAINRHYNTITDVLDLAKSEQSRWSEIQDRLVLEGVPLAISSGMSQYLMPAIINHTMDKAAYAEPTTVAMALCTAAPTSASTGASITEAAYTGYAETAIPATSLNSATAATPSVMTSSAAITFPNCTGGTSTLLGFVIKDSSTIGSGNSLWYGTLTSTTISTTQTPPTVASGSLNLQLTGT